MSLMKLVGVIFCVYGLSGCDRLEGKAKDFSSEVRQATRDTLTSDLQSRAEAICFEQFTQRPVTAKSYRTATEEPATLFESGNPPYPTNVSVNGDGKYQIEVPLFRKINHQGLYTGHCRVENGKLIESALNSPF
jgi:hypothetical protein